MSTDSFPTAAHWGNFRAHLDENGELVVSPSGTDRSPSPLGRNLRATRDPNVRVLTPMVRKGYLERGKGSDGSGRGREPFVAVDWDFALDLAADAIHDVRARRGDSAVYGSSYGWSSAGRFHHAQSQIHRFLRLGGGYTDSVNDYSAGAGLVIVPHITGMQLYTACGEAPPARDIADHCKLILCFGGIGLKNNQVSPGGIGSHDAEHHLRTLKEAGVHFINVSAVRDDAAGFLEAEWLPCRPGSDVALMLGLAHTLLVNGLHDTDFLNRYCHGFDHVADYLLGKQDGVAKDANWAASLTTVPADKIRDLALRLSRERSIIGLSLSVQRGEHGEQTYWAGTTLAAMLGHFGLPGGGIVYGYGVFNSSFKERKRLTFSVGALPQGSNPVRDYIPVARLTDMLERPGDAFDYNGNRLTYPDIGLIYWAGGNPFHHHQDLNRLDRVWGKPETIIVHDMYWTATARRADIVFPVATPLERNDFAASTFDSWITPMHRIAAPLGDARTDYDVFSALADRLGYRDAFTEGRDEMQWVRRLYEMTASNAARADVTLPDFDTFWHGDPIDLRPQLPDLIATFEAFRADPLANPLKTPSGKLQLYSDAIADFQYEDCKGHAAWFDKTEWLGAKGRYPLHLISSQPPARLHSQLDHGDVSRGQKIRGREPVRMNPFDARERGIADGDVVRLFNDRGAALAGVRLSDSVMPGVVQLPTGAWFDPHDVEGRPLDVHGNPNALTRDVGTSRLAQGTTAHSCMCDVELFDQPLPDIGVHRLPRIIQKSDLIADSAHGAVAGTPVMGRPASANLPVGKSP